MVIWNYSTLLFYSLTFSRFNSKRTRDLSASESKAFFDTYLIINSFVNKKIQITRKSIAEATSNDQLEELTVSNFIYQRDYMSTLDMSNQANRGAAFFTWLESHARYSALVSDYYNTKHVSGHLRLLKNVLVLISEIGIGGGHEKVSQLLNLQAHFQKNDVDIAFVETLCINPYIKDYAEDVSFGQLRKTCFYKISRFQFLVLDVNFLMDQLYKAQVFSFYAFLKSRGINEDFLSVKGKEFMEEIFVPTITYIKFYQLCLTMHSLIY